MLPLMTPLPSSLISTQSTANSAELDTRPGPPSSSGRSKAPCLMAHLIGIGVVHGRIVQDGVGGHGEEYRMVSPRPCWRPVHAPLTTPAAYATGPPWTSASGSKYTVGTRRRSGKRRRKPRSGGGRYFIYRPPLGSSRPFDPTCAAQIRQSRRLTWSSSFSGA